MIKGAKRQVQTTLTLTLSMHMSASSQLVASQPQSHRCHDGRPRSCLVHTRMPLCFKQTISIHAVCNTGTYSGSAGVTSDATIRSNPFCLMQYVCFEESIAIVHYVCQKTSTSLVGLCLARSDITRQHLYTSALHYTALISSVSGKGCC